MKFRPLLVLALVLFATAAGSPAVAEEKSVVTRGAMDAAVVSGIEAEEAGREAISGVLRKDVVRDQATRMGVDPSRLDAMVATLSGGELSQVAAAAANVEEALAGGDSIVIGATTLIIVLLVLIVILVAD